MTNDMRALTDQFCQRYQSLKASLRVFTDHLDRVSPAWLTLRYQSFEPSNQHDALVTAYSQMLFPDLKITGINALFGVAAVDGDALALACRVNEKKDAIADCVHQIRQHLGHKDRGAGQLLQRHPELQQFLESQGLARINLQLVYRHIPIAGRHIQRIAFSWTGRSRKILKLTPDQCIAWVKERCADDQLCELLAHRLALIGDPYVAFASDIAPTLVANLRYDMGEGIIEKKLIRSPLPVLCAASGPRPSIGWPGAFDDRKPRKKRNDTRIGEEPIVPGLKFFPYLRPVLT